MTEKYDFLNRNSGVDISEKISKYKSINLLNVNIIEENRVFLR